MQTMKKAVMRRAVRTTAKHSAHGATSKLRREPARAATLLALGALAGLVAGWLLARGPGDATGAAGG